MPIFPSIWSAFAAVLVAALRAWVGVRPYSTSISISRAPSPWAKTPISLPFTMVTPASSAALKLARLEMMRLWLGLARLPAAEVPRVALRGRERRAIADILLRHQAEDLDIPLVAVLDGLDARQRRPPHPFLRLGMGTDRHARVLRGGDDELEFIERERRSGSPGQGRGAYRHRP